MCTITLNGNRTRKARLRNKITYHRVAAFDTYPHVHRNRFTRVFRQTRIFASIGDATGKRLLCCVSDFSFLCFVNHRCRLTNHCLTNSDACAMSARSASNHALRCSEPKLKNLETRASRRHSTQDPKTSRRRGRCAVRILWNAGPRRRWSRWNNASAEYWFGAGTPRWYYSRTQV